MFQRRITSSTYFALVLLGGFASSTSDLLSIGRRFADKNEQVILNFTAEDLLCAFVREFDHQRQRFGTNEANNGARSDVLVQDSFAIVELQR